DARGHGTCTDQLAHRAIQPSDVEQVVLLAFREQNVLFHTMQNSFKRVLRDRRENSNGVLVPVMCMPWVTHQSNTELGRRSSATSASVALRSLALNSEMSSGPFPGRICLSVMSKPE